MSSPTTSEVPSYIQEIKQQFSSHPLPDFQLINDDEPFLTYPMTKADSPEIPMPPPITISPSPYPSLITELQCELLVKAEANDHPGDGWEQLQEAAHSHLIIINDPEQNQLYEAKYMHFMMSKESGEPEIWGTNGLGKDIVGVLLAAEPCLANINLGVDDTDLAPFTDINMFCKEHKVALWGLNNYRIIVDIYRL
jgi:hypothetical protein